MSAYTNVPKPTDSTYSKNAKPTDTTYVKLNKPSPELIGNPYAVAGIAIAGLYVAAGADDYTRVKKPTT